MDASEAIVEKLLRGMGFTKIIYEPDGNVPPDFLVDGRIAVEVRRLNQNHDSGNGNGMRGLEECAIPLWQRMEKLCRSLGASSSESWYVFFRFSRPVENWKLLEPHLRKALESFKGRPLRKGERVYTSKSFEIDVLRSSQPRDYFFCLGGSSDEQSGGVIVSEMLENIAHCSEEKLQKIAKTRNKYAVWWLVLTDHIGYGLDDYDKQQLLSEARRPEGWEKVIVVSPSDPSNWLEF